jgi:hypothetical protein
LIVCFNYDNFYAPSTNVTDDQNNIYTIGAEATDSVNGTTAKCYYALNSKAGTSVVHVNFTGGAASFVAATVSEFNNIAAAGAIDGSTGHVGTGTSVTAGSFTPGTSGDLIFQYAHGDSGAPTTWTQGPSPWSLLSANILDSLAAQYQIQASAAAINPTLTGAGGASYLSLGFALKAASSGTALPAGIRVIRLAHINTHEETAATVNFQFPTTIGNLIVIAYSAGPYLVSSITDSAGNSYVRTGVLLTADPSVEMYHAANATGSPSLLLTATMSGATNGFGATFFAYEIAGAAANPLDTSFGTNGFASASGSQDRTSGTGPVTTFTATPSGANELIIVVGSEAFETATGWSSPAGAQQIPTTYTGELDPTFADENNPAGVFYNGSSVAPQTWIFTHDTFEGSGTGSWSVAGAAFKPAAGGVSAPPTAPTNLAATGAGSSQINLSWTASTDASGIAGYVIERCQGAACANFAQIAAPAGTGTTYNDTGLAPSATYSYRVMSTDNTLTNSGYSNVATATTSSIVPAVQGPIALIQHISKDAGSTSSSTLAFPSSNTAGNWIGVLIRAGQSGEVFTVKDSTGNTYHQAIQFNETGNGNTLGVFYAENIASGPNTITVSDTVSNTLRFTILEYSGIATTNSLDVTAAAQGKSTSANSGNATTTSSGDLLLGAILTAGAASYTAGSNYKIEESVPAAPNAKLIAEDQVQAAAGPVSASATLGAADNWAAGLAAFKAASGGGASNPTITSLNPTAGVQGTPVTIMGTNFGSSQPSSTVKFNGTAATPSNWTATSITAPVPIGATTGNVVVTVGGVASNGMSFTVTSPPPSITNVNPASGTVGTLVTITGTNFGSPQGTSTIKFSGTSAAPTAWSATSITVPVPAIAAGSTTIVVTVGGVASNSASFTVTAPTTSLALIQHISKDAGSTSSSTLAFPSSNTAGNWIGVLIRAGQSGEVFTVKDSTGNTYHQAIQFNETGNGNTLGVFYAENIASGPNTITVSDTVSNTLRFTILEYSGIATTNSLDVTAAAQGKSTSANSGNATTTSSGDLLLGAILTAGAASYTAGSNYKIEESVPAAPNAKLIAEDQVQAAAGPVSASATLGAADNWAAGLAAFKAASGAAPPPISISVSPASASVSTGGTQPFTATLQNDSQNKGANWSLSGTGCSGSTCGTLSNVTTTSVTYNSPAVAPAPPTVTLTATSVADTTKNASATITVTQASLSVTVSPKRSALTTSQTQQFAATVTNDPQNAGVSWSVDGNTGGNTTTGAISSTGLFTPGSQPGQHTVSATSVSNASVSAAVTVAVTDLSGIFTHHNDLARTGQNLKEYALSPATVSSATFGRLFSCGVDGFVYAEPLYVANLVIGGTPRNVVFIATEHNSVYAFDADSPSCTQLWKVSFLATNVTTVPAGDTGATDTIVPEIGITSTPVIDPATNTIYVVPYTKETIGSGCSSGSPCYVHRLHALDLTTGLEKFNGPVVIAAPNFVPRRHLQRPALLLANNTVYVSFGSHGDVPNYQGWLLGYDPATLAQKFAWSTTDATSGNNAGAIWSSGSGPAVDASGNIYVETGNGAFNANTGGRNYSDSAVKLGPAGNVLDYFTPFNQDTFSANDIDLGSGGVVILPDSVGSSTHQHLALVTGKVGILYLLDQLNLGHFNSTSNQDVQEVIPVPPPNTTNGDGGIFGSPAYWNGNIYVTGVGYPLSQFLISNGAISFPANSSSSNRFPLRGATPAVSANGTSGGIVWILDLTAWQSNGAAILDAYDATNVTNLIYSSPASGTGSAGSAVKFTLPTVANGKVYVGGQSTFTVFGLNPN